MKPNRLYILTAILLLAAFAGCQREALPSDGEPLTFSVSVAPMAGENGDKTGESTKATLYNTLDLDAIRSQTMNVWAYQHDAPYTAMFENKEATYNSTLSKWQLSEEQMWKKNVAADFFASACIPSSYASVTANHSGITYSVTDITKAQTDALLGLAINQDKANSTDSGSVALKFSHPYAAVKVKVGTMEGVSSISKIEFSGIYGSGNTTLAGVNEDSNNIQQYSWDTTDSENATLSLTDLTLTGTSDALLVIPQTLSTKSATLTVTTDLNIRLTCNISTGEWKAGYVTTYKINISAIGITVTVDSWSPDSSKHDVEVR